MARPNELGVIMASHVYLSYLVGLSKKLEFNPQPPTIQTLHATNKTTPYTVQSVNKKTVRIVRILLFFSPLI